MRPTILLFFAVLVLTALPAPAQASDAGPLFFEKVLIQGDENDYNENGALDIKAVYAAELTPYDVEKDNYTNIVAIRIDPRTLNDIGSCLVPSGGDSPSEVCWIRYDLYFTVGAAATHLYAVVGVKERGVCCIVTESNGPARASGDDVTFNLPTSGYGLVPGASITRLYVTSSLVRGGQVFPADRAPGDNGNVPYDQKPELDQLFAPALTLAGTYRFFNVDAVGPTHLDSVYGEPVRFQFRISSTDHVKDDTIRIRFDAPKGWIVTPSKGSTGINPTGLVTGMSGGMSTDFAFTASPNDALEAGTVVPIVMRLHSFTEGFETVPVSVRITGTTIESPDYVFRLVDGGPFRASQTNTIHFQVLDAAGVPRTALPIDVTFMRGDRQAATVPAVPEPTGYAVSYEFPSAGTWTIDPRVAGMHPAPHGAFTVQVEPSHATPGPGVGSLVAAFAAGLAILGRRPGR